MSCVHVYREAEKQKEVASLEAWAYKLIEMLSEQRSSTRDNIQRKQARTGKPTQLVAHTQLNIVCRLLACTIRSQSIRILYILYSRSRHCIPFLFPYRASGWFHSRNLVWFRWASFSTSNTCIDSWVTVICCDLNSLWNIDSLCFEWIW